MWVFNLCASWVTAGCLSTENTETRGRYYYYFFLLDFVFVYALGRQEPLATFQNKSEIFADPDEITPHGTRVTLPSSYDTGAHPAPRLYIARHVLKCSSPSRFCLTHLRLTQVEPIFGYRHQQYYTFRWEPLPLLKCTVRDLVHVRVCHMTPGPMTCFCLSSLFFHNGNNCCCVLFLICEIIWFTNFSVIKRRSIRLNHLLSFNARFRR